MSIITGGNRITGAKARGDGFIPIDITSLREVASSDIQNLAAHGGILALDSTPALKREATDNALKVEWGSGNTDLVVAQVPKPPDMDPDVDVTLHFLAMMGGATDTPTITVQAYDGRGDSAMGTSTGALSDSLGEVTSTISASDLSAPPGFLTIEFFPDTHATDAVELYAVWIEYTKRNV